VVRVAAYRLHSVKTMAPVDRVERRRPPRASRIPRKMALGIFTGLLAAAIAVAAFVFIWFGFFPSLALLFLCLPLTALANHLMRTGRHSHPR
jgi:4-hydroxybenzoate polyprenyltransferase